jgi:signal transduction histidine kinase
MSPVRGPATVGWVDRPWFRRNLRFAPIDLLVAGAFTTVFLVSADNWSGAQPAPHRAVDTFGYGLLIGIAAVLLVRRWAPRPALLLEAALVGVFVGVGYPEGPYFIAMAIVGHTVGRLSGRRDATWSAICATCLIAAGNVASFDRGFMGGGWALFAGLAAALLVGAAPIVAGALVREHRSWRATAQDEAQARLIDAERLRMAREVHDVVGHSLSIISLQAGVALHVLDRRPEQAQLSLEAIRRTSVEALDELRATLALTRAGSAASAALAREAVTRETLVETPTLETPTSQSLTSATSAVSPPTTGRPVGAVAPGPRAPVVPTGGAPGGAPVERAPLTGLGRLPGLLAEVRLCGVPVEADIGGPLDRLPADVDLAAYRIVQESLTNVLRHARGAQVTIRLRVDDGGVAVEVTDVLERPVGSAPVVPAAHGHGLTGLRERASELGGELTAGPCGSGWRVHAHLPLPRAGRAGGLGQSGDGGQHAADSGGHR